MFRAAAAGMPEGHVRDWQGGSWDASGPRQGLAGRCPESCGLARSGGSVEFTPFRTHLARGLSQVGVVMLWAEQVAPSFL